MERDAIFIERMKPFFGGFIDKLNYEMDSDRLICRASVSIFSLETDT